MKVTLHTSEQLIIEDRPWLMGLGVIAVMLAFCGTGLSLLIAGDIMGLLLIVLGTGMGGLAFWGFVRRSQAVFHGPGGYVELREKSLSGMKVVRHDLDEIAQARVESMSSGNTRRVALVIPSGQSAGTHPLRLAYTSHGRHEKLAAEINAWLDSHRSRQ